MKIYCQNCGYKVEFSANSKPKFCHNCGTSLNLGSNVSNAVEETVDEEELDITNIPIINALEVEIHTDQVKGEKLPIILSTGRNNLHTYPVMAQHTSNKVKLKRDSPKPQKRIFHTQNTHKLG